MFYENLKCSLTQNRVDGLVVTPMYIYLSIYTYTNVFIFSTLLVLTLTMRELRHWPSIAGMSPQSHCGDVEDGRIGFSSWLHYICITLLALYLLSMLCVMSVSGHKWFTSHRVLKSHKSKMGVIYVLSWKQSALSVITTMALWQLGNSCTWAQPYNHVPKCMSCHKAIVVITGRHILFMSIYINTYTHTHTHRYIYIYIHTHTYTYIHTHRHTHI